MAACQESQETPRLCLTTFSSSNSGEFKCECKRYANEMTPKAIHTIRLDSRMQPAQGNWDDWVFWAQEDDTPSVSLE